MARRRMIDPNFWASEDVSKLSINERLFLIGLFSNADDYGKGIANPAYLRSIIFPYDDIPVSEIKKAIAQVRECISITFYKIGESQYYKFDNWDKWQRVDKPQPSIIPDPDDSQNDSENDSGMIPELVESDSCLKEVKRKEEKEREENIHARVSQPGKVQFAENVSMTNAEYEKLVSTYGEANTVRMVEKLDNYKGANGKKYKSDYRAILNWVVDEVVKKQQVNTSQTSTGSQTEMLQRVREKLKGARPP